MTVQLQRVLHMVSIKTEGFPAIAEMIEKIPPEKFQESLIAEGIVGPDGTKPWEARAVAYTDAFMKKNYGAQEPQRISYSNGKLAEAVSPVKILTHSRNTYGGADFPGVSESTDASQCTMPTIKGFPNDKISDISLGSPETIKALQDIGNCLHAVQISCHIVPLSHQPALTPAQEHNNFLTRISRGLFR